MSTANTWTWVRRAILSLSFVVALVGMGSVLGVSLAGKFGNEALAMKSGSMSPAINPGDLLFVQAIDANSVRTGDIITFRPPNRSNEVFTHRVASIDYGPSGMQFHTKGDVNAAPDSWTISYAGPAFRVAHIVRHGGVFLVFVQSRMARALIAASIFALALALIWPVIVGSAERRRDDGLAAAVPA